MTVCMLRWVKKAVCGGKRVGGGGEREKNSTNRASILVPSTCQVSALPSEPDAVLD